MKLYKKLLIALCVIALIAAPCAYILLKPVPAPPARSPLRETAPAGNALRDALEVDGVGGSRFYIQYPKESALKTVPVSQFGASPANEDNTEALNGAFAYCAQHPGTRLLFEKGVYYVAGALRLENVKDCCVDGNGAKILYNYRRSLLTLFGCECVKLRGPSFDWDWDEQPLGAVAHAVAVKG